MKQNFFTRFLRTSLIISFFYSGVAAAGQWKPFCVEGAVCNADFQSYSNLIDRHAAGPLPVGRYIWFQYPTQALDPQSPNHIRNNNSVFRMDTLTGKIEQNFDQNGALIPDFVSDVESIGLSDGTRLSIWLPNSLKFSEEGELIETRNLSGHTMFEVAANKYQLIPSPVELMGVLYVGYYSSIGHSIIYHSIDNGQTWEAKGGDILIDSRRYSLMANPEQTGLWAISPERSSQQQPASLWESIDDGDTWAQVDNGSFPENTVRIVHDLDDTQISYALTSEGLYVSTNRGIYWRSTLLLGEAVHGMVFIDRTPPLSRALVVGTDSGVKISTDEGNSWLDMNKGLLNIPHTVTYHNGVLVASSDAGYFTCNSVDCGGEAQAVPAEEERGLVTVTEFYNTDLGHYFMTPSEEEVNGIDQGSAGPGWVRTGETFQAWSLLGSNSAANLCRLYGSVTPGPNSHFFTLSTQECSSLLELEQTTPATKPRWNFEQYSFMAIPPAMEGPQPCPDDSQPVYRAYNGGFARGEDSNHRYVTDPALLEPMVQEGWVDEGVVFCVAQP